MQLSQTKLFNKKEQEATQQQLEAARIA